MKRLEVTPAQREQIDHDRFHHPCPQIQKRMEVLRLAAHGLPQNQIAQLSGLSIPTVQRRLADFRRGGLDAVRRWNYRGRPSVLRDHAPTLEDYFRQHPPATVAEAQEVIAAKTGIRRGLTQVRAFLKTVRPRVSQSAGRTGERRSGRPATVPR